MVATQVPARPPALGWHARVELKVSVSAQVMFVAKSAHVAGGTGAQHVAGPHVPWLPPAPVRRRQRLVSIGVMCLLVIQKWEPRAYCMRLCAV